MVRHYPSASREQSRIHPSINAHRIRSPGFEFEEFNHSVDLFSSPRRSAGDAHIRKLEFRATSLRHRGCQSSFRPGKCGSRAAKRTKLYSKICIAYLMYTRTSPAGRNLQLDCLYRNSLSRQRSFYMSIGESHGTVGCHPT